MTLKLCIFGAGAIGGFVGVQLSRAGVDVSLVARGAHLEAIRRDGLRLEIDGESHVARLPCSETPSDLGTQDYVFIALKAHQIADALDSMRPLLDAATVVVTASNGLPYWFFAGGGPLAGVALQSVDPNGRQLRTLTLERAIGCVVYPATDMPAPGVIRHEHGRRFPLGEPDGQTTPRLARLHEAFEAAGLEAPIRADIRDEIWLKLWGNLCFNPVSALTQATIDVVAGDAGTRAVCRAMMLEAAAIGERLGLRLRVDVERRLDGAAALGPHRMSMLQDLQRGRSMEVESLVGVIAELGRHTGIPTPTVDVVLALIRQRERYAAAGVSA